MSELPEGGYVYKKYDLQDESRVELLNTRKQPVQNIFCHEVQCILNRWAVNALHWRAKEGVYKNLLHALIPFRETKLLSRNV